MRRAEPQTVENSHPPETILFYHDWSLQTAGIVCFSFLKSATFIPPIITDFHSLCAHCGFGSYTAIRRQHVT